MTQPQPPELSQLTNTPERFKRAGPSEWHGPCPRCGGTDRFRVWTDRAFPHWRVACRQGAGHCGFEGWADEMIPQLRQPLDPEQVSRWKAEREAAEVAEAERLRRRLAEFTNAQLWSELHRRMTEQHRAWWRGQGIYDAAQDTWRLGYTELTQWGGAYSIPYFSPNGGPVNMQYRLANPPANGDKYRWAGLGYSSFWTAWTNHAERGQLLITEGAKKGLVSAQRTTSDIQICAVPSKSDFAGVDTYAKEYERVWIILDPDAIEQAHQLQQKVGEAAYVVRLPGKLDDLMTEYNLDFDDLRQHIRQARRMR